MKINLMTKGLIQIIVILIALISLIISIIFLQSTVTNVNESLNEKKISFEKIKESNKSLISVIFTGSITDPALRKTLKNYQVLPNGSVRLNVQDTEFNQLIRTIENLEKNYNINLYSAEIVPGKSSGNVNAVLEFQSVKI